MSPSPSRRTRKNPLEWAVFTVSLLAILATIGFLVYDAITHSGSQPDLRVELGPAEERSGVFAVPVTVRNGGDETAEGVRVEVELEIRGEAPEKAGFEIAFVPRQSRREGWVTFRSDPRRGRLTARAAGYEKP